MRIVILIVALLFIGLFALLTGTEIAKHGLDVLSLSSVVIVAIMGFGIIGALRHPPSE